MLASQNIVQIAPSCGVFGTQYSIGSSILNKINIEEPCIEY